MLNTPTINKYLAKLFMSYLLVTTLVVIAILFISNSFDILQKFKGTNVSPIIFWQLVSFRIPHLFYEIAALVGFISTIIFLNRLSTSKELVILSSSSLQNWRIYLIPIVITLLFGCMLLALINPLGTYGLIRYEKIESRLTNRLENTVLVSQNGIFFYEQLHDSHRIIEAKSINTETNELTDVTILIVDSDNNFLQRLDASKVKLYDGNFYLYDPTIVNKDSMSKQDKIILSTELSVDNLAQKFISPELIYIWNLKNTISKFSKSGIITSDYELYYYKQLLKPLVMSTMVLLACLFVSVNCRENKQVKTIIYGLVTGLISFFAIEITSRLLTTGGFDPLIACLLPTLIIILLSNFVILHFQEA